MTLFRHGIGGACRTEEEELDAHIGRLGRDAMVRTLWNVSSKSLVLFFLKKKIEIGWAGGGGGKNAFNVRGRPRGCEYRAQFVVMSPLLGVVHRCTLRLRQ